MSSLEELKAQLQAQTQKAAMERAHAEQERIEAEKQELIREKMASIKNMSPEERTKCTEVFHRLFGGRNEVDPVAIKELSKSMGTMRPLTDAEATVGLQQLDMDGDGKLNFDEFCVWWLNGAAVACGLKKPKGEGKEKDEEEEVEETDAVQKSAAAALSIMRTLLIAREAHSDLLDHVRHLPPPQPWTPDIEIHVESTVGTVNEETMKNSQNNILVALVPSSEKDLNEAIEKIKAETKHEDDDEEEERHYQAVGKVTLKLRDDADDEKITEAIDMMRAIVEEYNAQDETPVDVKIARSQYGRAMNIGLFVRKPPAGMEEDEEGITADPLQSGLKALGLDNEEFTQNLFEKVLVGVEFGNLKSLNVKSGKPAMSVLDSTRVVVDAKLRENIIQILDASILKSCDKRGISHRRNKGKLSSMLLSRLLRKVNVRSAFVSPLEMIDRVIDSICNVPIKLAAESPKYKENPEILTQIYQQSENLRNVLQAVVQREFPWHACVRDLFGHAKLDKFLGDLPRGADFGGLHGLRPAVRVALTGTAKSGKSLFMNALAKPGEILQPVEVDSDETIMQVVPPKKTGILAKSDVILYEVNSKLLSSVAGMDAFGLVHCIDASSKETAAHGVAMLRRVITLMLAGSSDDFPVLVVLTNVDKGAAVPIPEVKAMLELKPAEDEDTNTGRLLDAESEFLRIVEARYGEKFPAPENDLDWFLRKATGEDGGEEEEEREEAKDEDEPADEEGNENAAELAQTVAFTVRGVVEAISDITFVSPLACAVIRLGHNLSSALVSAVPQNKQELLMLRITGRGSMRGLRKSSETVRNIGLNFSAIEKLLGELEKEDEDESSASSKSCDSDNDSVSGSEEDEPEPDDDEGSIEEDECSKSGDSDL